MCGVSKSLSFLKVLCGGVSGQSGTGELNPSRSSWMCSGEPLYRREVFLGDGEQLVKITLLGNCRWDSEPKLPSSQSSAPSSPPDWFRGLLPLHSSRLSAVPRRAGTGESISAKPDSPPVLLLTSSMWSSSASLDVNTNFCRIGRALGEGAPCRWRS